MNAAPGNLIRWGRYPSVTYVVICGRVRAGRDDAALVTVLSTGGSPCTDVIWYPAGAVARRRRDHSVDIALGALQVGTAATLIAWLVLNAL